MGSGSSPHPVAASRPASNRSRPAIHGSGALIDPLSTKARARHPPLNVPGVPPRRERIARNPWLRCQISSNRGVAEVRRGVRRAEEAAQVHVARERDRTHKIAGAAAVVVDGRSTATPRAPPGRTGRCSSDWPRSPDRNRRADRSRRGSLRSRASAPDDLARPPGRAAGTRPSMRQLARPARHTRGSRRGSTA